MRDVSNQWVFCGFYEGTCEISLYFMELCGTCKSVYFVDLGGTCEISLYLVDLCWTCELNLYFVDLCETCKSVCIFFIEAIPMCVVPIKHN